MKDHIYYDNEQRVKTILTFITNCKLLIFFFLRAFVICSLLESFDHHARYILSLLPSLFYMQCSQEEAFRDVYTLGQRIKKFSLRHHLFKKKKFLSQIHGSVRPAPHTEVWAFVGVNLMRSQTLEWICLVRAVTFLSSESGQQPGKLDELKGKHVRYCVACHRKSQPLFLHIRPEFRWKQSVCRKTSPKPTRHWIFEHSQITSVHFPTNNRPYMFPWNMEILCLCSHALADRRLPVKSVNHQCWDNKENLKSLFKLAM